MRFGRVLRFAHHTVNPAAKSTRHMAARHVPTRAQAFPGSEYPSDIYGTVLDVLSVPVISGVWARQAGPGAGSSSDTELLVTLSHSDAFQDRKFRSCCTVMCPSTSSLDTAAVSADVPCSAADTYRAPSGKSKITVEGSDPAVISVFNGVCKTMQIEVPSTLHGALFNDSFFGRGLQWSSDERYVAYVAERGKPKPTSAKRSNGAAKGSAECKQISKDSRKREDWGEGNTGKEPPMVFILDLLEGRIMEVPGQLEDASYGQPCFTDTGLIMVRWPHECSLFPNLKKRLGLVYCFDRDCSLVFAHAPWSPPPAAGSESDVKVQGLITLNMDPPLVSCMEPRVSPNGSRLVFISHDKACDSGVHYDEAALHVAQLPPELATTPPVASEVSVVHQRVQMAQDVDCSFPGLYSANLAANLLRDKPFVDDSTVVLTSVWGSKVAIVAANLDSRTVSRISPEDASYSLVANNGRHLFALSSTFDSLPALVALECSQAANGDMTKPPAKWLALPPVLNWRQAEAGGLLGDMEVESLWTTMADGTQVEAVVCASRSASSPRPAVLSLHGGPHAAVVQGFSPSVLAYVSQGFTVIMPNFRGSTGYSPEFLHALPGNVGKMDVADCIAVLENAVERHNLDRDRLVVQGGSHGGFLTGHCIGQHPGLFKAAALRNPVLDISFMVHITDIPDWSFVEVLGGGAATRQLAQFPVPADVKAKMQAASPIAHVHNVTTPALLFLGSKDRRVPCEDGNAYVAGLRRYQDVQVHQYPDDAHPLAGPETSLDVMIKLLEFFRAHTGGTSA